MTISSSTIRVSYAGNGSTTEFSFPHRFLNEADLIVIITDDTTGVETTQTLNTHYTVDGEGDANGGSITFLNDAEGNSFTPASGETLVITNNPDILQPYDPADGSALSTNAMERAFDKLTLIAQRTRDLVTRSFKLPDGDTSGASLEIPSPTALNLMRWDSAGTALENVTLTDLGDSVASVADNEVLVKLPGFDADGLAIGEQEVLGREEGDLSAIGVGVLGKPASLSALQALNTSFFAAGETVYLRGRTSVGDGGEGHFRWDSSNLSTEVGNDEVTSTEGDGGIYIAPASDKTGASGAWVRQGVGTLRDIRLYGAVAGSGNDNTTAIQALLNGLPGSGGAVYVPTVEGSTVFNDDSKYFCDGTLTVSKPVSWVGDGQDSSVLAYTGSGLFIDSSANTREQFFDRITITGVAGASGEYFVAGSLGVKANGLTKGVHSRFARFNEIIEPTGGFYHKYINCEFDRFGIGFPRSNSNNFSFFGCRTSLYDTFFQYQGGAGPLSAYGCSFESFTTRVFSSTAGARAALNIYGCYFENKPGTGGQLALGLAKDDFNDGQVESGADSITIVGCLINTQGIVRVINETGNNLPYVRSEGNRVSVYNSGDQDTMDFYCVADSYSRAVFRDTFFGTFGGTAYVTGQNNSASNKDAITIIDPDTGDDISPQPDWTNLTLENSWADDTGGFTPAYRVTHGYVEVRGTVDGASATATVIATLPSGARPTDNLYWTTFSWDGSSATARRLRVTQGGAIVLSDGFGAGFDGIPLDMIRFEQEQ